MGRTSTTIATLPHVTAVWRPDHSLPVVAGTTPTHPALDEAYVRATLSVVAGAGQDARSWALGMLDNAAGTLSDDGLGRATRLVLGVLGEVTR